MAKRGRPKKSSFHKAGYSGPVRRVGRPSKGAKTWDMLYNADGTIKKGRGRPKGSKSKSKSSGKKTVRATIIFD